MIRNENAKIMNIWTWEEVYHHFFERDSRLSPYELYQETEERPYRPNALLDAKLKDSTDVPDTLGSDGGADGGVNPRWSF
jgi:hypothetical protein